MPASASSGMRHNVMNKNRKTPGNAGDERRKTPIFVSLSLSLLYLLECVLVRAEQVTVLECHLYIPRSYFCETWSVRVGEGFAWGSIGLKELEIDVFGTWEYNMNWVFQ
jgi:hypothetical protein